ncbi:BspA family leucine-rich repeat surface protein, partial [Candidatus Thioglobus sp.]|nr:BspA family leucine-rich repeat surface protein [Candidatus Thioglobus sp.]
MLQKKYFHIFLILLLLLGGKFAYAGCTASPVTKANLTTEATAGNDITTCNVSGLNDLSRVFINITGFNQDISAWDVSNVTTMESMFEGASSFNQDISSWDVSSVTDMEEMFDGASAYNNGGAGLTWGSDTGSVTSMHEMFKSASSFNQDISPWDVSSVRDMKEMFKSASAYNNGGAVLDWSNTGSVTTMQSLFASASAFNNGDSGNNSNAPITWNTSSVTSMRSMFKSAIKFNQDISPWNVSSVTDMAYMFNNAAIFNNGGVALDWVDLNDLVYAHVMFSGANYFNQSVSTWQLGSVQTMNNMFAGNLRFNQDISDWDVSTVTTFYWMFNGAGAFNNGGVALDWTTFAGSSVSMQGMFRAYSVFNQDISSWNVTGVNNFSEFLYASYQFSQANYDLLLVAWDALNLTDSVTFHTSAKYTGCSAAATARASIISNDSWTINDGGATACPAPTLSSSAPADNATAVAVDANIVLTFDQAVDRESGNVTIKKTSDDSTIEVIAVTDSKITGTGTTQITINPTSALAGQTEYYVLIAASAFDDPSSNSYAGISSTTALSFTTADIANPTLSSSVPADNATAVAVDANIVLNFSEAVDRESGNVTIKKTSDDSTFETISVTDSKITGTGTTQITINPAGTFASSTEYYV